MSSSEFRFEAVPEPDWPKAADTVAALLAEHPTWVEPFTVLHDGLTFRESPMMSYGAQFFESATQGDPNAVSLLEALEYLFREVREARQFSQARGAILERYLYFKLRDSHAGLLGPCKVTCDGEEASSYRLDAATGCGPAAVGIEAKASERTLKRITGDSLDRMQSKVSWVIGLRGATSQQLEGVFVTWATEEQFRAALKRVVGDDLSQAAVVIARGQLRHVTNRLNKISKRLNL